jgi:hypothetical protein
MNNLINLIDGVDGLAGGISLMLMLLMSVVGGATGCVSLFAAGMGGALIAFLRFNFPPARIYMGDGGSYFLGFLIGLLTITSSQKGTVLAALIAPLLVLTLPILDTSLAILRRGLRGLPLFRADNHHIHHRMLQSGLSERDVVLGLYAFTAFFLGLGLITFWGRGQFLPLILGGGLLAVLLTVGRFSFSREWFAVGRVLGNSLNTRTEIHYTLAQTRWLVLEGARSQSIEELCEDTVFIARKLGFDSVQIQLEKLERTWHITPDKGGEMRLFRQKLPGHDHCFIELGVAGPKVKEDTEFLVKTRQQPREIRSENGNKAAPASAGALVTKDYKILSELLAEGWAKAIATWEKRNGFDGRKTPVSEKQPEVVHDAQGIPSVQTMTT